MALRLTPQNFDPSIAIPNSPFYTPETYALCGYGGGSLVVGSGLCINYVTAVLCSSGAGSSVVSGIYAGPGIGVSANTGAVTICNEGVRSITIAAPLGISTSAPYECCISLTPSGVTPGTYVLPSIDINSFGLITNASSVALPVATTASCGIVQLASSSDVTSGTSSTLAVTPLSLVGNYIPLYCFPAKGSLIAGTGLSTATALAVGLDGNVLTACAACPTGLTWAAQSVPAIPCACITGQGALVTGTAANTPVALPVGSGGTILSVNLTCSTGLEWVPNCVGTVTSVTAGTGLLGGAITASGTISIDTTCVLTTALFPARGTLLTASGPATTCSLLPGIDGQFLIACSACLAGVAWGSVVQTAIPCACITDKGSIIAGIAAGIPSAIAVGTDGQILTACSACATGLTWTSTSDPAIPCSCIVGKGSLVTGTSANTPSALPVGSDGRVLIACSACTEGLTWALPASGSLTCVDTGTGLLGGPITTSGTISLANTAVSAGSYTNASFTVDPQGRLTAASSGTAPVTAVTGIAPIAVTAGTAPTVSIASASTTTLGAVQLYNNVDSTSTTLALTAQQGKVLQDQINALNVTSNLTLAGTFDAATGQMLTLTSAGGAAGFAIGSDIPAAAAGNLDYFIIVTTSGNYSPPGGGGPYTASQGDWFLSNGATWQFLNVGPEFPYATIFSAGTIRLSTNALALAGSDSLTAITPVIGSATYVMKCEYAAKGNILAATAASTPTALTVGTDGQVLTANSASATGLCWSTPVTSYIPCATVTAKGALVTGTAASTPAPLSVGTDGQILAACAACATGLAWVTPAAGASAATPLVNGLLFGCSSNVSGNTSVGWLAMCAPTGPGNTALGACALRNVTGGANNIGLGFCSLLNVTTGCNNVALGPGAGLSITSGSGNVVIGGYQSVGQATDACRVILSDGFGNFRLGLNGCGALSFADTTSASYGSAGQVLQSNGELARPTWVSLPAAGIPSACITAKGTLVTGTAANSPVPLAVGTNGQILTACSTCATGLAWTAAPAPAIPCACLTAKGDLIVAQAASTPVALPVGTNGQVLSACSACAIGVAWTTLPSSVTQVTAGTGLTGGIITSAGTIALANTSVTAGSYTNASITVDAQGRLTAASNGTPAVTNYTATKSITTGTPISILTWPSSSGFRAGRIWIWIYSAALNDWTMAEAIVSAASSGDTSGIIYWAYGLGDMNIVTTGGATTFVFTPIVTATNVQFSYQYLAGFGPQPTIL